MSSSTELPVILVSARSEEDALNFISELTESAGTEWLIVNKYYSARVRLRPDPDPDPDPDPPAGADAGSDAPEGHVIYLAEDECTAEAAERRRARGGRAAVRVLAAARAELAPALAAWAARAGYAPAPLLAPPEPAARDPAGPERARAALHAHAWPGLRRAGAGAGAGAAAAARAPEPEREPSPAEAEAWAAAALGAARAAGAVRALPAGAQRRAAAEALLARLARALGHSLDDL